MTVIRTGCTKQRQVLCLACFRPRPLWSSERARLDVTRGTRPKRLRLAVKPVLKGPLKAISGHKIAPNRFKTAYMSVLTFEEKKQSD